MAIGYSIKDFYTAATTFGLARTNAFRIKDITGPAGSLFNNTANQSQLLIFAKDGTIPSRQISTGKVNYKAFSFVVPLDAQYPENSSWKVTFYGDSSFQLRQLMEAWSVGTYNEHSNTSSLGWVDCNIQIDLIDYANSFHAKTFTRRVPQNPQGYETFPLGGFKSKTYTLVGCFPTNIGQISYDNTSTGSIVTLDLTLAFQYIISENQL